MSVDQLLTPKVRNYLYAVATAAMAVAVAYGLISPDQVPLWLSLAAALLAITATSTATVVTKAQRDTGQL